MIYNLVVYNQFMHMTMITVYNIVTYAKLNYVMNVGIVSTVDKKTIGYVFSLNHREYIFARPASTYITEARLVTLQYTLTSGST